MVPFGFMNKNSSTFLVRKFMCISENTINIRKPMTLLKIKMKLL